MTRYITKRILMSALTLLAIIFVLFVLIRIMPGDPFPVERMSAEMILQKREELGLNNLATELRFTTAHQLNRY